MEHRPPESYRRYPLQIGLDIVAKLTVPAALWSLAHGATDMALLASVLAVGAGTARGFVLGNALRDALLRRWDDVVKAIRARPLAALRTRREDEESVAAMMSSIHECARFEASIVPQLVSTTVCLAVVVLGVVVTLQIGWLILGAVCFAVIGLTMISGQKRLRAAEERAWGDYGNLARDVRVLLEAPAELRAAGREGAFAAAILTRSTELAGANREASRWSAILGLVPAGIALLSITAPIWMHAGWAVRLLSVGSTLDVGVLGGSAVMLGLGLARTAESAVSSAPLRRTLASVLDARSHRGSGEGSAFDAPGDALVEPGFLLGAEVDFQKVSYTYAGASRATPFHVDFKWEPRRGLAILGENGSGKSTLALAILGLLRPTSGRIVLTSGSRQLELGELDPSSRRRVAYVPQGAFVSMGASVGWHLGFLSDCAPGQERDPAEIEVVLERVGLLDVLEEHASRTGRPVLDVPAGELSGGERQRMHLARAILQEPELLVLDEPEIGLDQAGRRRLREILEELAPNVRVVLIAHDESVIPTSYQRLRVGAPLRADERSSRGATTGLASNQDPPESRLTLKESSLSAEGEP